MKTLRLSDSLVLPLPSVTEKFAFLGRTGSGKTYGAMKLAELMLDAGAQIGVLDPVGVWRALRVPKAPGGRSFEVVVFGGLYGDLPLEPTAGELIADLVCDRGISFVLDVSQFINADQQRFVQAFADRFFNRKKAAPSAVHLFMEECQEFIPENPSNTEAKTLGIMQRLWKLGRNFGIGGSLISQRPQEIAKKALNMSSTLFVFQMTGPQERKTVKSWVADHGVAIDIESVLQKLAIGQPHVESPTFLGISKTITILPRLTADLSSTPKVGGAAAVRKPLTPIDVDNLRAAMAASVQRAKAEDPKELQRRIATLEAELQKKPVPAAPLEKRVEVSVLTVEDRAALHALAGVATCEPLQNLVVQLTKWSARAEEILTKADQANQAARPRPLSAIQNPPPRAAHAPSSMRRESGRPEGAGGTSRPAPPAPSGDVPRGGLRRMLIALAQRSNGLTNRQIGLRAGLSSQSGTFSTYMSKARSEGWIQDVGEVRRITPGGEFALGAYEPLPVGRALLNFWLGELGGGASRMLQALADYYPEGMDNETLGIRAGISHQSGTFSTYMSRLRGLELITGSRGSVKASEELFS